CVSCPPYQAALIGVPWAKAPAAEPSHRAVAPPMLSLIALRRSMIGPLVMIPPSGFCYWRPASPFQPGRGDAFGDLPLENDEENEQREQRDDGHGEQHAPGRFTAGRIDEEVERERRRVALDLAE